MKKTVLVIGDIMPQFKSHSSFRSFLDKEEYLYRRKIDLKVIEYYEVLDGHLPRIDTQNITVMMFFPYHYWDDNIEVKSKNSIYGDEIYGKKFTALFKEVEKKIISRYKDKNLEFINSPSAVALDRDKKKTKAILKKNGLPAPELYRVKSHQDVLKILEKGKSVFIKPRFGAMGKGITFLSPQRWETNFIFRKGKIISRQKDYGWKFVNITGSIGFLKALIKHDVICEEAIERPVIDDKKFDFRVYVIFGKVPYLYAKTTPAGGIITNWSQGGKIEKRDFLKKLPGIVPSRVKSLARKSAVALNLNYAGIDIIFSRDFEQAYVLEAHSFPGYERGFDLMKFLIKKI